MVRQAVEHEKDARLKAIVGYLDWPRSSFFRKPKASKKRPGPVRKELDLALAERVREAALRYPWWGYRRLAVVLRRQGISVSNRFVYQVLRAAGLLQKAQPRSAELYQAAKLFDLLPKAPNDLWQADVTYLHIPGHGWWYAVTVIDYYSRFLLALHLTPSFSAAAIIEGLGAARKLAEQIHGPLSKPPILVTDNGSSFLARKFQQFIHGSYSQVRTRYRTPEQLGLLERFHRTLKKEEVYWHTYDSPADAREKLAVFHQRYNEVRPHWALIPMAGGDPVTPAEVYRGQVEVGLPAWQSWALAAKRKIEELLEKDAQAGAAA
jgi:putative transposase